MSMKKFQPSFLLNWYQELCHRRKNGREVQLTSHLHPGPWLRRHGDMLPAIRLLNHETVPLKQSGQGAKYGALFLSPI